MNKVLDILSRLNEHVTKVEPLYSPSHKYDRNYSIVFRGHADKDYELSPSLFRKNGNDEFLYPVGKEHILINEYIKKFPEFSSQPRINVIADMQHYGLPTRLLDWTSNPLIALYFACSGTKQKDGSILFGIKDFYLSSQASLAVAEFLSNFASCDSKYLSKIKNPLVDVDEKNLSDLVYLYVSNFETISRLHGALEIPNSDPIAPLIKIDNKFFSLLDNCLACFHGDVTKKQFISFMQVLYSPYCFIDAPSINPRIIAQQGLFQVFAGKHYDGYNGASYKIAKGLNYTIAESEKIIIASRYKDEILLILDKQFNINESTLYLKDKQQIVNELKSELKILN